MVTFGAEVFELFNYATYTFQLVFLFSLIKKRNEVLLHKDAHDREHAKSATHDRLDSSFRSNSSSLSFLYHQWSFLACAFQTRWRNSRDEPG